MECRYVHRNREKSLKITCKFKQTVFIAVAGCSLAFGAADSWIVLDDFSDTAAVTNYMAYDSDTATGRDVVYGLDNNRLKSVNTIIRAGYAGGFWWTGGELLTPGDSVKIDFCVGAQNICNGFRFSLVPFGKALTATDTTSSEAGTIVHGTGTVYSDTCWVNVYQRAGETLFQLTAGSGGTGQGGVVTDGIWLTAGAQPTTNDLITLVVTRGTGTSQDVLTWSFEGDYLAGNSGTVTVPDVTANTGLYFALNLNGSSVNGRFDNLTFKTEVPGGFYFALLSRNPAWLSDGSYRLILQVPDSSMTDERDVDERPAIVTVDFEAELAKAGVTGKKPDLSTLQLVEYDTNTGLPVSFTNNAVQETAADRPVRWYDDAIPFNFPDFSDDISTTGGTFSYDYLDRWGYFYGTTGDWKKGRLAWVHTQRRGQATCYAAYFDLMDENASPSAIEPRDMIGDGIYRTEETGDSTTGLLQTRIALDDWDGDGLVDIIAGSSRGQISWWPNVGTISAPRFVFSRMLFMDDGKPLDAGRQGSPTVTDWDGDGVKDLIVSSLYKGRLNFFKNTGSNVNRVFSYRGFLNADGQIIESPYEPNPETLSAEGVQSITRDYYSQPITVDWDNDGDLDLLTGGYVTGQIEFYENTGSVDTNGLPVLTYIGPVALSNGTPLDVGWCASPAVADLNSDGTPELISGLMTKAGLDGTIYQPGEVFLRYFEGVGTSVSNTPLLELKTLPKSGSFPTVSLATPCFLDFNHDGLQDLIISAGMNIYLVENIGSATSPVFDAGNMTRVETLHGNSPLPLRGNYQDLNDDGHPDIVDGFYYYINTGEGYPFRFTARQSFLPVTIDHPVDQGDGWRFYLMVDFNNDGEKDVMFGDFWGQVWFHENLGNNQFDTNGVLVVDTTGEPIQVGPDFDGEWDFTTLQGARLMFACADFTGDGRKDIITRDTLGDITFFERDTSGELVMQPGVVVAANQARGFIYDVDWNADGRRDAYLPGSLDYDIILLNTETGWVQEVFERPGIPVAGAAVSAQPVDLNEDGDFDILITNGEGFTSLFEKTFLEQGYAQGEIVTLEPKVAP